jgi:DNA (cytosine-5)-methyltransferase 1
LSKPLRYGSVCSGIEAATVAWHPLGWQPVFFAETAIFPSTVLTHHYPEVPNYGDFTAIKNAPKIDLLVAGTPCQSFSVAGKRAGMDDPCGVLALEYLKLAGRLKPRWLVFENVPGLLSSGGGRDFAAFLKALADCGYQCAWRVLDAQYFGVAQRRRRLFVVGHLGDWRRAAAVLFEREILSGASPTRGKAREEVAGCLGGGSGNRGWCDDTDRMTFVAMSNSDGHASGGGQVAVCVQESQTGVREYATAGTLRSDAPGTQPGGSLIRQRMAVRRLTPREAERLQGFSDGYTLIPYRGKLAADGPRYRAIGNSMAVPVMRWIGERIQMVDGATGKNRRFPTVL